MVDRVLHLYDALLRHFLYGQSSKQDEKFMAITKKLQDPLVRFMLTFYSDALKPLQKFELLFQKVTFTYYNNN